MAARLRMAYEKDVKKRMMDRFKYSSVMKVPKIEKIILNVGEGEAHSNPNLLQSIINELSLITGQKAVKTVARKSIAAFKIREGYDVGARVTLRGDRMYEFLDRFINITSPRIRDFRGFNDKSFDGRGNYSIGIKEQIIFPEIDVDKVNHISGLDITFVMKSKSDEESRALLSEFGFPFRKND